MIERFRQWLRAWLGIKDGITAEEFTAFQEGQQQLLTALQSQLLSSKQRFERRPVSAGVPRPYDYESAQVAQLQEFEEKPNGVH